MPDDDSPAMASEDRHGNEPTGSAVEKIKFISSPLDPRLKRAARADTSDPVDKSSPRSVNEIKFVQHDDASNLEVLYDLFLACLNVFSTNVHLDNVKGLSTWCGFFCIIWTTWFLTGMYDVRFLKDSLFERCARGVHLGVLVGFVVVSPKFHLDHQDPVVFRVFTIILMASRLCLAAEYGSVLYYLRDFPGSRLPVGCLVAKNFAAALVYLGISFRFREGHNSKVFSVWYIVAGFEIIGTLFLSYRYKFLSFQGTYVMKRMVLLTCIFFGEAVLSACHSITRVIKPEKHVDVWTPQTIGTVTAAIALIYIVYLVYIDWASKTQLPSWRQMTWVLLHFPMHLVMMLFMEGISQLIIFWKLAEKSSILYLEFIKLLDTGEPSSISQNIKTFVANFTARFPPTYTFVYVALSDALAAIDKIDFVAMSNRLQNATSDAAMMQDKDYSTFLTEMQNIILALDNTLYATYGIDFVQDVANSDNVEDGRELQQAQAIINARSLGRARIVFQYTFVCAGCFLAVANILSIISRTKRWTWRSALYHATIFLLALGIGLVTVVSQNPNYLSAYQSTPWVIPTLLFAYLLVLVMNNIRGWLAAKKEKKSSRRTCVESQDQSDGTSTSGTNKPQCAVMSMERGMAVPCATDEDGRPERTPNAPEPSSSSVSPDPSSPAVPTPQNTTSG